MCAPLCCSIHAANALIVHSALDLIVQSFGRPVPFTSFQGNPLPANVRICRVAVLVQFLNRS